MQACCDNLAQLQGRTVACSLLATEVFNLLYDVTQCITRINPDTQESYPDSLVSEWNEFYTVSAFNQTISLFVKVAGKNFLYRKPSYRVTPVNIPAVLYLWLTELFKVGPFTWLVAVTVPNKSLLIWIIMFDFYFLNRTRSENVTRQAFIEVRLHGNSSVSSAAAVGALTSASAQRRRKERFDDAECTNLVQPPVTPPHPIIFRRSKLRVRFAIKVHKTVLFTQPCNKSGDDFLLFFTLCVFICVFLGICV